MQQRSEHTGMAQERPPVRQALSGSTQKRPAGKRCWGLTSGRLYHVTAGRWLGETLALRWLIDSQRPFTKIVRYEDLVTDPNRMQAEIGTFLELEIETPADEYHKVFKPPPEVMRTMQGLRPPDVSSIGRWKSDPEAIAYPKSMQLRLSPCLPWIEKTFGYDISLS